MVSKVGRFISERDMNQDQGASSIVPEGADVLVSYTTPAGPDNYSYDGRPKMKFYGH